MLSRPLKKLAVMAPVVGAVVFCAGIAVHGQAARQTPPSKAKAAAKALLDLNSATAQELQELPGVGEATARKIIGGRPYSSVDDLTKAGVPARTLDAIRAQVRVAAATSQAKTKTKAKSAAAPMEKGASKVNVNTAEITALESLPGVGEAIAKAIVAGRPWKSVDDLAQIRGLGHGPRFEALRDLITVDGSAPASVAAKRPAMKARSARDALKTVAPTKEISKVLAGQKININTASKEELDVLPGIGTVKAQAIIDGRPFNTIEDIMKVKGIKGGEFARIKDLISVK
jgi:competence protein ComEA